MTAACTDQADVAPLGPPSIFMGNDNWLIGETNQIDIKWAATPTCTNDALRVCDTPDRVLAVDSVSCDGCTVINTAAGSYSAGETWIPAVAQRDGTIMLTAKLTYLPTGETTTVTATAIGDHEVALDADCNVMWASQLDGFANAASSPSIRPCEATRRPDEVVLIRPKVRTLAGSVLYPFDSFTGPNMRPVSSIATNPAPDRWVFGYAVYMQPSAASLTLSTNLSSGAPASTTVAIPPVP